MAFSENVVKQAWENAEGRYECRIRSHDHPFLRCNKPLVWENRGREGWGAWEAHHIDSNGGDTLSNCEILCWDCHSKML